MLSLPHLIVIFIVALIVFGPEKLPELARNLGKWTAEFRRMTGDLRSSFEEQMHQLERETAELERQKRELAAREAALNQAALPPPVEPVPAPDPEGAAPASLAASVPVTPPENPPQPATASPEIRSAEGTVPNGDIRPA